MATKAKISLVNAFLKLAEKSEFDKITVTSLVESCGISRQTFYYHFDDIDKMIAWAFKNETDNICKSINYSNLSETSALYSDFLKRYDALLKKAHKSSSFIKIYNLLNKSFYEFISAYVSGKHPDTAFTTDEAEFFLAYCASAFTGLITTEIQKDERNYEELMQKMIKVIKTVA